MTATAHGSSITLDELRPCVDFASDCDQVGPVEHRYRIPGCHFILVGRGRITARTPSATVVADGGEMLCFPPTEANRYGFQGPVRFWETHIHFAPPPDHGRPLWLDGIGAVPLRVQLGDVMPRMQAVFELICAELPLAGAVHRARTTAAAWELVALLAECLQGTEHAVLPRLDRWQRTRARLADDRRARLSISRLAAMESITTETLIRGFQERFGLTPGQYRTRLRLQHAAVRLRADQVPIKALAAELGFADAYSFSRAFRRHFGLVPSQLRSRAVVLPTPRADEPALRLNVPIVPPSQQVNLVTGR